MASDTAQPAVAEQAIFALSTPLKFVVDGVETDIHGLGMRGLDTPDLPLLDQFHGQPVALAQNMVAALCDITLEQVRQLDIDDFTMLASDAIWQIEQASSALGLPPRFFLQPPGEDDDA